jgi:prefoldin subunit 4
MTAVASKTNKNNLNDEDVHISYEDQSKINKFAINNTKLHDYQDELNEKKKELQNISEAIDELILLDNDERVPFQYGEVFTHLTVNEASEELEKNKTKIETEISNLIEKLNSTKNLLSELKTQLYAKFGNKINLEENEEE